MKKEKLKKWVSVSTYDEEQRIIDLEAELVSLTHDATNLINLLLNRIIDYDNNKMYKRAEEPLLLLNDLKRMFLQPEIRKTITQWVGENEKHLSGRAINVLTNNFKFIIDVNKKSYMSCRNAGLKTWKEIEKILYE